MQFIDIPESSRLRGEKAVEALCDFVDELEKQRSKECGCMQKTITRYILRSFRAYADGRLWMSSR